MIHTSAPLRTEIEERLGSVQLISLFLDFDGTLAPISADPTVPRLDPETAATLQMLAGHERLIMTIISGRAVEDLYTRIRINGIIYAGNHGLEIFGRQFRFVEPLASQRAEELERLCESLAAELRSIAGALVERKGLTASVHYRLAAEANRDTIQRAVYGATARHGDMFRVNPGRKVYDIVPRTNWHKGAAVQWINHRLGEQARKILTVYVGDDTSDEDAFTVLPDAVTIKVGAASVTCARYQLPDPPSVHQFLQWFARQVDTWEAER